MSKVLVTGGAGFIGSHLVDALIKAGKQVFVIDNLSTGTLDNLNPKATFRFGNIQDVETWDGLPVFKTVFHLAAMARIQPSINDPLTSNDANVNGTLMVLQYCRKHEAKLVFASSSSIYDGEDLPTGEYSDLNLRSPYALQKHIGEQYIRLFGELYGLRYAIVRYFNVYGDRQLLDGAYATVLGIFLDQRSRGVPLTITGDGEQRRDFTHIADIVKGTFMAKDWQGTFNLGAGRNYSVNQLAEMVGGKTEYIPARPGEVRETLADSDMAKALGWRVTQGALENFIENS